MLVVGEFEYTFDDRIKKLSSEQKEKLFKSIPELLNDDNKLKERWSMGSLIFDEHQLRVCSDLGINVIIKRFKGTIPYKIEGVEGDVKELHFHAPNTALIGITKVDVLEACCTDELQLKINEGWRIICVCPPLNKRRPDYIIGK